MKQTLQRLFASTLVCCSIAPAAIADDMNDDGALMPPPKPLVNSQAAAPTSPSAPAAPVKGTVEYSPNNSAQTPAFAPTAQPYYGNAEYGPQVYRPYGAPLPYGYRQYSPYIPPYSRYGNYQYQQQGPYQLAPRLATAPAGLVLPVTLQTSISTQVASTGDYVQADISRNMPLQGFGYIPAGSQLSGEVTNAEPGRMFGRSGLLSIRFNSLRLPNGQTIPIQAHTLGNIARYAENNGVMRGEGWGTKIGAFALRSAIGAGAGAVLGTAIGAIASRGRYVGRGAWAGTAIGGGLGVMDDLVLRRGRNVLIHAGTPMQIQLDEPIEIPVNYQMGNA